MRVRAPKKKVVKNIKQNNMAIIPAQEKVFMVSNSTNTTYSGSAALKAMQQWYTMQDVSDSIVAPYKVFTALLTQTGGGLPQTISIGTNYGNELLIGSTYKIMGNDTTDFTNVGAPNNNVGTSFIATGNNPNNQNGNDNTYLGYDTGAPVATVLENTIGNIWFTYDSVGIYVANSNALFTDKIAVFSGARTSAWDGLSSIDSTGYSNSSFNLITVNNTGFAVDDVLSNTPIEIRVYN
jgi:hypothetical protein